LAALLAAGSLLVHELRYVAGYGGDYRQALAEQGHSYTTWLEALTFALIVLAGARFGISLVRARGSAAVEPQLPRLGRLWLCSGTGLAAIYTLQEGLEGAFAPGHPSGLVGVYGHSGWTALLFSLVVGGLIALITRIAHQVIASVAARTAVWRRRIAPAEVALRLRNAPVGHGLEVLAWNLAGRAPPPHT
jgi:hypothetical protein